MGNGLDLLLIHPPSGKRVYQSLATEYSAREPPYLSALTAQFVRDRGFEVNILDADAENLSASEAAEIANGLNPGLIQIVVHGQQPSASTQLMPAVGDLCKEIKSLNNNKILLTGTHPSALPERTIREEEIDFVGRGEGFFTVLGLLKGEDLSEVPGLWYMEDGNVVRGARDSVLSTEEMGAALKGAAWDLLPMDKYKAHGWHCYGDLGKRSPYASIYTSFGCGMGCEFCCIDAPFTDGGTRKSVIRFRGIENIVDEIEMLHEEYGISNLKIIDEMFVFNREHYVGVAEEIIKRGLGGELNIWAYSRIDTVREGNLDLLKRAGFNALGLGIESGSSLVRVGAEKPIREKKILDVVETIKSFGIYPACNYIFGLEDDTMETMQQTLDLAIDLNGVMSNLYCAMAYPGSLLHLKARNTSNVIRQMGQKGIDIIHEKRNEYNSMRDGGERIEAFPFLMVPWEWEAGRPLLPEDEGGPGWIGYSQHSYETLPLPTTNLFPESILAFRDSAYLKFNLGRKYLDYMNQEFGEEVVSYIEKRCEKRLKRRILGH